MTDPDETLIRKLLAIKEADDLIDLLIQDPDVRNLSCDRLLAATTSRSRLVHHRIRRLTNWIKRAQHLRARLLEISNLRELAALAMSEPLVQDQRFRALVERFESDAASEPDSVARFQHVRAIASDARQRTERLNSLIARDLKGIDEAIDVTAPDFLDWLAARQRYFHEPHDEERLELIEHLEYTRRRRETLEAPREALPNGMVRIRMPVQPGQQELWFLPPDEDLFKVWLRWGEECRTGKTGMDEALAHLVDSALSCLPKDASDLQRSGMRRWAEAASCRWLIQSGVPSLVRDALLRFRAWLDNDELRTRPVEERLSYVLRYAIVLLPNFVILPDARRALEDIRDLLNGILAEVDPQHNPGIARDALLTRARVKRDLRRWDGAALDEAIEDFRAGLAVDGGKYDREVRGRGLADLASALAAGHPDGKSDGEIQVLFEDAIAWLEGFPTSQATALMQSAIFHNERSLGDDAKNQERALAAINKAIDTVQNAGREYAGAHYQALLATLSLTRGNILRARRGGVRAEHVREAIRAYQAALNSLPEPGHVILRGEITLNLAYASLDVAADENELAIAAQHARTAGQLLRDVPESHARTQLLEADIWLESHSQRDDAWRTHLDAVERARRTFLDFDNAFGLAKASFRLAELRLIEPAASTDIEEAIGFLKAAHESFMAVGDFTRALSALDLLTDALVGSARQISTRDSALKEARQFLAKAVEVGSLVVERASGPIRRRSALQRRARLVNDLLWVDSLLGSPIADLHDKARRAKGLDTIRHVRDSSVASLATIWGVARSEIGELRRQARIAEAELARSLRTVPTTTDLAEKFGAAEELAADEAEALLQAEVGLGLDTGTDVLRDATPTSAPADCLLLDVNVSRWGTLVFAAGGGLSGVRLVSLELSLPELLDWYRGSDSTPGWMSAYMRRDAHPEEWVLATEWLIQRLGQDFWSPTMDALGIDLNGLELRIAPGALGSLPLLEAIIRGTKVLKRVRAASYVVRTGSSESRSIAGPRRVLCLLADPARDPQRQLRAAPAEVATVASAFAEAGDDVTIVASAGTLVGRDVLTAAGATVPERIRVLDQIPTPTWVMENVTAFDFALLCCHGTGVGPEPALLLVDETLNPIELRILDVVAVQPGQRSPAIVLSACETAFEGQPAIGEATSLAAAFLRIGARNVIGSLWVVPDDIAAAFSVELSRRLAQGEQVAAAFVEAACAVASSSERTTAGGGFCHWTLGTD